MKSQKDNIKLVQQLLTSAKSSIHSAEQLLRTISGTSTDAVSIVKEKAEVLSSSVDGKVVEGIFNGISMIGPEDKEYKVPENYASKSKLVEGDVLKLTIAEDGGFVFKQIGPVPRKNIIGDLIKEGELFKVVAEGKPYKVLQASVTYHKAEDGDRVTIIVPEKEDSNWAALENVVNKTDAVEGEVRDGQSVQEEYVEEPVETGQDSVESEPQIVQESPPEPLGESVTVEVPEMPEEPGEGVKELEI